ncbi:hypothetical protein M409DRAFT_38183 [Zasmidium cellare ATCC 36951]|uniref:Cytochrome P450 n=1 Tax=Zasmidium cellare ATCC 36951 TaxID=1080233 RepID=A0A6A6BYQ3_ZASCE|nr:uncharacterized protein M409DRAFT_38183 [Zasmidium cellare ATCC 36951]KAF2158546.1 hypothetical protein M409DRAFT_38183 [Zasmidium cellare ATCC 36951]
MFVKVLIFGFGTAIVWLGIIASWRLFFGPLAHIPGPRLAALTFLYEIYFEVFRDGTYIWEIERLHKIYGPVIRVNPREVHIADYTFVDEIYSSSHARDKDIYHVDGLNAPSSLAASKSHYVHRRRREALNNFFSRTMVKKLEGFVQNRLDGLDMVIERAQVTQQVICLSDLYFGLSQDIVKQYGFGNHCNLVRHPNEAATARENMAVFLAYGKLMFWLGWAVGPILWLTPSSMWVEVKRAIKTFADWRSVGCGPAHKTANDMRTIFDELRNSPTLPEVERSAARLEHEAILLVAAGSESTAKSMSIIHYHLLRNERALHRLRKELETVGPGASWTELERLPFLAAVVQEGNRLNFGLTGRSCRVSHENLCYRGLMIPPGTPVSTMSIFVNANEKLYPDPWTFNPDRWLEPGAVSLRKFTLSFGKGSRSCIGMQLAHMELYLTIARTVRWEMVLYETGDDDVRLHRDFTVSFPKSGSRGVRAVARKRTA